MTSIKTCKTLLHKNLVDLRDIHHNENQHAGGFESYIKSNSCVLQSTI